MSEPGEAAIQIIPVEVTPKRIVRVSNSALVAPPAPQPVSIGEELEFELQAMIPVAQLRSFVIRDELPVGLGCSDAPVVDLGAPPYAAAGFTPGGVFTPTCTDTEVVWDFGNQTVTQSPRDDRRFDFAVRFVARVDNVATNQEGLVLRNGGSATSTTVRYVDQLGNDVVIPIEEADAVVREPVIALTKAFSVAEADAGDVPRVTVTATNTGTATAYNLQVLEDLSAVDLTFVGDVQGTDPPTVDVATFGTDRPLFGWPAGFALAPGEAISFSFAVQVDGVVEPLQNLPDTIQADWTSLPGRTTALNPLGQIGPDGSPTGMRNGALPASGDPTNDYEAQATAAIAVPPVTLDKVDLDPALVPEIGAHKAFQVEIALPEGTTNELIASDDLGSGTVSYVLADNADFDVSYEFVGIASINGQPPSEAAFTRRSGRRDERHRRLERRHGRHRHGRRPRRAGDLAGDPHPLLRAHQQRPGHQRRQHAAEHRGDDVRRRRDRRPGLPDGRHRRRRRDRIRAHRDQGSDQRHGREIACGSAGLRRHPPVRRHHRERRQRDRLRRQRGRHAAPGARALRRLLADRHDRRDGGRGLRRRAGAARRTDRSSGVGRTATTASTSPWADRWC